MEAAAKKAMYRRLIILSLEPHRLIQQFGLQGIKLPALRGVKPWILNLMMVRNKLQRTNFAALPLS